MKTKSILLIILLSALILSACTASISAKEMPYADSQTNASDDLPPISSTSNVAEVSEFISTLTEREKNEEDANGRLMIFKRSGGYAGQTQEWIIYDDGTIIDPTGKEQKADPKQLESMVEKFSRMRLKDSYVPLNNCCDHFTYTLTVFVEGEMINVTTMDGAKQPAQLTAVINDLHQLLTN